MILFGIHRIPIWNQEPLFIPIWNQELLYSIKTGLTRPEFEYAKDDGNRKFIIPRIEHPEVGEMKQLWDEFMPMS